MIKEFQYNFEELSVSSEEIEELMGFEKGEIPEPFPELISTGLAQAPNFTRIKGGYKIFESAVIDSENWTIQIEDRIFSPTKVVTTQLKNASAAALFICTAGTKISAHSKQLAAEGDTLLSYVFDVIGSITVDKAMDKIEEELKQEMTAAGLHISDRFSPGYCEWSVADQQKLFALLPPRFCGITLTESSLMNPIKSVSGIIGIGRQVKQMGYQCNWCNDINCIYGKMKRKKNN
jgi:hypothetical protein